VGTFDGCAPTTCRRPTQALTRIGLAPVLAKNDAQRAA